MNGHQPLPVQAPYAQPSPLTAPRAQPPPSQIPTERLASTADDWGRGSTASPAPPPAVTALQNDLGVTSYAPMQPSEQPYGAYAATPQPYPQPPPAANPYTPIVAGGSQVGHSAMPGYPYNGNQQTYTAPQAYAPAPPPPVSGHNRPASYAQAPPPPPVQQPVPAYGVPPAAAYYPHQQQQAYVPPPIHPQPPQPQGMYLAPTSMQQPAPMQGTPDPNGYVSRPPRVASMQPSDFAALQGGMDSMRLSVSSPAPSMTSATRPNYYASPEDGPPYKLSVTPPDQAMLASVRETAHAGGGDMSRKVAWSKQVLKLIERHQSSAGESSRITDPTLVRWTDEALNHILTSASSPNPVPLALYLRGDLSSTGSFPSYRSKDTKASFRDFEAAANAGYHKAWFRIGRAYEDFGDVRRAVGAYEKGVEKGDCGSTYRLAMAYLLGQIGVIADINKAMGLLRRAADGADLDTPQPPYVLGMLLSGEFESPGVTFDKNLIPIDLDEAKWRVERAAYLNCGPAQYKMGYAYEYATMGCLFDPLLSVQYYALASQNSEVEADMALSKWYLCGSEGNFDKNEGLAVTFAEKAAARQLPAAEFALGYFHEVGIGGGIDLEKAKRWYERAASHGNTDAKGRLDALKRSSQAALSRTDHDSNIETRLVRKRTQAQTRSEEQRELIAATKLRASLSGQQPQQQPPLRQSQGPPPPINVAQAQAQYKPAPQQPLRQSTGGSYPSSTFRRQNTIRQVEAAARMGPGPPGTPNPGRFPQQPQQHPNGPRPLSYQLTDSAPQNAPQVRRPSPQQAGGRPQAIQMQPKPTQQQKPATFAEMGITTQKAKNSDCAVIM
ncbi:hypothetical protein JCM10908_000538 [Rhodotorula pacifica]|uniref:uncharacterized protein n=1 Tax=Rhodotorula pacifica TaxID=1495444 RepID=UPI00317AD3B2